VPPPNAAAAEDADALGANTITCGTAASPATPRMTIAGCQPAIPIRSWARGMIVNWLNEPPALMMPVVTERLPSGIQRLTAEMSIAGPTAPALAAAATPRFITAKSGPYAISPPASTRARAEYMAGRRIPSTAK
jgi:hypothetical protein